MIILEDTRQQEGRHKIKHDFFRAAGIHWNRTALYCGDYTLPADQSVCIDTKKNVAELVGDIYVKSMPKSSIMVALGKLSLDYKIPEYVRGLLYHAITDNDYERFAEGELSNICFQNDIPERALAEIQRLYVKRHGFFHRGLKRAQNSGIKLYVLVENLEGIKSINDLFQERGGIRWISTPEGKSRRIKDLNIEERYSSLGKALLTMQERYGVEFQFCSPEESGKRILELLGIEV